MKAYWTGDTMMLKVCIDALLYVDSTCKCVEPLSQVVLDALSSICLIEEGYRPN